MGTPPHRPWYKDASFDRDLFNNLTDAICIVGTDGRFLRVNKAAVDLMGYSEDELLGMGVMDCLHPDDRQGLEKYLEKLMKEGVYTNYEGRILTRSGNTKYIEVNSRLIRDKQGQVLGSLDIIREITRRKQLEIKLAETQERYEMAVKASNYGLWDWPDMTSSKEWWSDRFYEILGYRPGETESSRENFEKMIHPDDLMRFHRNVEIHFKRKKSLDIDLRVKTRSGKYRWYRGRGQAVWDEKGEPVRMSGSLEDIHERKTTEEALRESEQRFRILVTHSEAIIFLLDKEGKFLLSEGKGLAALDLTPGEAVGASAFELYRYNPVIIKGIERALKGEFYTDLIEEKGVHFTIFFSPYPDAKGETIGVLAMAIDITDRIRAEKELESARKRAEESDKLKTAFLTNLSHEIRTPMNAIIGFSHLLKENNISEEQKAAYLNIIIERGNDLLQIISDIIDISRIEAGDLRMNPETFSVEEFLEHLYNDIRNEIRMSGKTGVELTMSCGEDIKTAMIRTDPVRLRQVFRNIYTNALKFTEAGSISLGCRKEGYGMITFLIKDTGIGIDKDDLEVIFERFRQLEKSRRTYSGVNGLGLGLAISRSIIEHMNGRLWAESEKGKGSTFFVSLPCFVEETITPGTAESRPSSLSGTLLNLEGRSIMVVEDDDSSYLLLESVLNKTNADIHWAKDGHKAYEMVREKGMFDAILMDIRIPGIDGLELTRMIRKKDPAVPIIILSAYSVQEVYTEAMQAGCNDFASKPLTSAKILSLLKKYLVQPN